MLTICFWNLNKRPEVLSHLVCLAQSHAVDVFILAECPVDLEPAVRALNGLGLAGSYREEVQAEAKVRAVTRLGIEDFVHRFTGHGRYLAAWTLRAPSLTPPEALVVGVHLPSKAGGFSMTDQASVAMEVIKELTDIEDGREHRNTTLIGDFNMHPYDEGMTLVTGFHGLMTRRLPNCRTVGIWISHGAGSTIQCGDCLVTEQPAPQEPIIGAIPHHTTLIGRCWTKFWFDPR